MKTSKPSNHFQSLDEAWDALAHLEAPEVPEGMEDRFWLRLEEELSEETVAPASPVQTPSAPWWLAFWQSFQLPAILGTAALVLLVGAWWYNASNQQNIVKNNGMVAKNKTKTPHKTPAPPAPADKELQQVGKRLELYSNLAMFQDPRMLEMFENYNDIEKATVSKKKGS